MSSNGSIPDISEEKVDPSAVEILAKDTSEQQDGQLLSDEERKVAEARIKRALDMRLMPTMIVIFILNYIDRIGITSARLKGLEQDLHLSDLQYEAVIAIFCASYCPAQIPSNMIIHKVKRPSVYMGACVILWGLCSAMTGLTQNFTGMVLVRIAIGFPEAAFYPGAMYLLSRWYTKKELSFRSAILYGGLLISNAFGSFIAAGILSNMEGARGIRAWRWLFFIEVWCFPYELIKSVTRLGPQGAVTVCFGFLAIWALPDFPHNTSWMSPAERRLAQARLAEDAGEADEDATDESIWHGLKLALMDPKVPLFALMSCSQLIGLSFINFFPTLTATLGYNTTITLLLAAPPWIWATIVCCLTAWSADKTGERFVHVSGWWWGVIVGYIIGLSTMSVGGRYMSLFLMASGYTGFALTLVWVSNAIPRPPAKRSIAMGVVNGFGNIGNLIGSFVWKANWSPEYHQSMIIGIATLTLSCTLAFVIRCILIRENRLLAEAELKNISPAERERVQEAARLEGITFEEAMNKKKGFRYLY
ncbi:MFS general substrate transporter [Heliocybe sulcata]|uniref:MFS general substrate transporter n=1 Tax=Heliocybe sulcata TaxID=5364 RepID=A0A5C3N1G5_9AGAM|nr:MFS general substrate transporter [Heliocybe sulcata]